MNSIICVNYLLDAMSIRPHVLADMLNVTVETLKSWLEKPQYITKLTNLTNTVAIIQNFGPRGNHIYEVLNEPLDGADNTLSGILLIHSDEYSYSDMISEIHTAIHLYNIR